MSVRGWRASTYALILVATLLAVAGGCAYLGEGISIYRLAIHDEVFVMYNALAMAQSKFSYSLDSWIGYRYYSLLPSVVGAALLSVCGFFWNLAGANFWGDFDRIIFVARVPSIFAFVISLFFFHDLLLKRLNDPRMAFFGLFMYLSTFGPFYAASISRAEGLVLASTIIFYWSLFRFGPRPNRRQWWTIAVLAGIPAGVEIYGSIMPFFSIFFFMLFDRYLEWKESGFSRRFVARSALLFSFVSCVALMTALLLNMRAIITPLPYLRQYSAMISSAKNRIWEVMVTWGVGPRGSAMEALTYLLEFLIPVLAVAAVLAAIRDFRERRYSWWLFALILGILYWEVQLHTRGITVYLLLPLIPLCIVIMTDAVARSRKAIFYFVAILCAVGFARVATLQIARLYDHSYYDAYRFILDDAKGRENVSLFEYGYSGQRHVTQKALETDFRRPYKDYLAAISDYPPVKRSLVLPDSWQASDSNDIWPVDREKAMKLVDDFLAKGTGQYDYVIVDFHYRWYENRWCHARNPQLAEKWREMEVQLRQGREKVFETGGIDSRFMVHIGSSLPAWSWAIAGEFLDWFQNREHRKSPFGPLVEVYKRPVYPRSATGNPEMPYHVQGQPVQH